MKHPAIRVVGLGKSYIVRHKDASRASYATVRDLVSDRARAVLRSMRVSRARGVNDTQNTAEEFWALKGVSLEIPLGQRVGVVGRNGAGKSTLLKLLSRVTTPSCGRIELRGRVASLLEVGTGFHPELSGRENIFLNGTILGMSRKEIIKNFDEIVEFAGVSRFLDTPVKHYSSGMYVRLAFAVAAHLDSEIAIIDEVLAVGDAQFQKKCLGKMGEMSASGRTVIFVSHNLSAVRHLCERGIWIGDGSVLADGKIDSVVSSYFESMTTVASAEQSEIMHIKGDGRALITSVTVGAEVASRELVPIFGRLDISLSYELRGDLDEAEFFVLVTGSAGDVVLSSFQRDRGRGFSALPKRGRVKVSLSNTLVPGEYVISAGIFDRHRQFVDWAEYAGSFTVESRFDSGKPFDGRLGLTTQCGDWVIDSTEASNDPV